MMRLYCGRVIGGDTRRYARINGLYYPQKRNSVCRSSSVAVLSKKCLLDSAGDSWRRALYPKCSGARTSGYG
jgi:hypothetical protein